MKQFLRLGDCHALCKHRLKHLKIQYISLLAAITIMCLEARAQRPATAGPVLSGIVTDTAGTAIPGATVAIRGTSVKTLTDDQGQFTLRPPQPSGALLIKYLGHQTIEEKFDTGNRGPFRFTLLPLEKILEEVVVSTGFQSLSAEKMTGSFAQPVKVPFDERISADVITKLEGITSGLVFNRNTTATSRGETDINIRGRSTIHANDQPLIVVDNFPFAGDINNINPNDIQSVTILKDAAAASIWGVRAGNGVIVITTKKGSLNTPLQIKLNSNMTMAGKPDIFYNPYFLSPQDYTNLERELFALGAFDADLNNTTTYPIISPVVEILSNYRDNGLPESAAWDEISPHRRADIRRDIRKYLHRRAVNQQYALSLSGGANKASYLFSAGYDNMMGHIRENGSDRLTLNTHNNFTPFKGFEVSVGLNYIINRNQTDNTMANVANSRFPYMPLADDAGKPLPLYIGYRPGYLESVETKGFLNWTYYPLNDLGIADNRAKSTDTRITGGIKYRLMEGLNVDIKYQYQRFNTHSRNLQPEDAYYTRNLINQFVSTTGDGSAGTFNIPPGGILHLTNASRIAHNFRGQLNYDKRWVKHGIALMAGIEYGEVNAESASHSFYGYNDNLATHSHVDYTHTFPVNPGGVSTARIPSGGISGSTDRIRSLFSNITYTYLGRYIFSASARRDGSNYFGVKTNQKNVPLWSTGIRWDVHNERFFTFAWLPRLSVRATHGYNGNLDRSITGVTTFSYRSNAQWSGYPYAVVQNYGNPDLGWEKIGVTNMGIDFALWDNRLSGSIEYFTKKGTGLLGDRLFPASAGLTALRGNYADMTGRGIDITIQSKNIDRSFKWTSRLLFSRATDEITRYDVQFANANSVVASGTTLTYLIGKPVYGIFSYRWAGLDPANGDPRGYDANGIVSKDYTSLINPDFDDLVYNGPARPVVFGALNNIVRYKGFTLFANISYKFGYFFRRPTTSYSISPANASINAIANTDYTKRWQKPGDELITTVPSFIYPFENNRNTFYTRSEVTVASGSHIRLQDISLSYMLKPRWINKLSISSLRIYIYTNNLGLIWKRNNIGLDPDAIPAGFDYTTTPMPRTISIGLKAEL